LPSTICQKSWRNPTTGQRDAEQINSPELTGCKMPANKKTTAKPNQEANLEISAARRLCSTLPTVECRQNIGNQVVDDIEQFL
jgi:hypothetical protein